MPNQAQEEKDRRLAERFYAGGDMREIDKLMGTPLVTVEWWEYGVALLIVAVGIILAVLGAVGLIHFFFWLLGLG
jgi:hypothetical protein